MTVSELMRELSKLPGGLSVVVVFSDGPEGGSAHQVSVELHGGECVIKGDTGYYDEED